MVPRLDTLPTELLCRILYHLDYGERRVLGGAAKRVRAICDGWTFLHLLHFQKCLRTVARLLRESSDLRHCRRRTLLQRGVIHGPAHYSPGFYLYEPEAIEYTRTFDRLEWLFRALAVERVLRNRRGVDLPGTRSPFGSVLRRARGWPRRSPPQAGTGSVLFPGPSVRTLVARFEAGSK